MENINETRFQKDLQDHEPRLVSGVRGVKSKPFSRKFRNQDHMEKWLDLHGDDHEIHTIEKVNENMYESSDVVDSIITNEPAKAVEAMQELIKAKARDIIADRFGGSAQEEDEIDEDNELKEAMKLDKVNHVHHDDASVKFAKDYVKGQKGDYRPGGPVGDDEKHSENFHNSYEYESIKSGFGGSGEGIYTHKITGEKFHVSRFPNGKGFHGTDHLIKKIDESTEHPAEPTIATGYPPLPDPKMLPQEPNGQARFVQKHLAPGDGPRITDIDPSTLDDKLFKGSNMKRAVPDGEDTHGHTPVGKDAAVYEDNDADK